MRYIAVGQQALRALMTEVCITPKPGLVDRANNGAHKDMNIFTFIDSATALFPYFCDVAEYSQKYEGELEDLLPELAPIGIKAEEAMFRATGGVNTHKGAIFSLGILCAAAVSKKRPLSEACALIAKSRTRGRTNDPVTTNGERIYTQYGISGILGEAAAGFPNVFDVALPVLRKQVEAGSSLEEAGVAALLHLIASVDDTNIIARRGIDGLRQIQKEVGDKISSFTNPNQYIAYAEELDERFIGQNISPGGCADLLAAGLFVLEGCFE